MHFQLSAFYPLAMVSNNVEFGQILGKSQGRPLPSITACASVRCWGSWRFGTWT